MAGVAASAIPRSNATAVSSSQASTAQLLFDAAKAFLASLQDPLLEPFLADWPVAAQRRTVQPSSLPVLTWLPKVNGDAPPESSPLVTELSRAAPHMAWRQTYHLPDVDAEFLRNYGWTEIVGLQGEFPSTRIACGFLLLGPATRYPRHRHEAEEIYVPLAGTASWQQGDGIWRDKAPGTVVHHASDEPHAMRTDQQPLLAIYLWRSANLNQKARLDPAPE
jgi:hypothetical protein